MRGLRCQPPEQVLKQLIRQHQRRSDEQVQTVPAQAVLGIALPAQRTHRFDRRVEALLELRGIRRVRQLGSEVVHLREAEQAGVPGIVAGARVERVDTLEALELDGLELETVETPQLDAARQIHRQASSRARRSRATGSGGGTRVCARSTAGGPRSRPCSSRSRDRRARSAPGPPGPRPPPTRHLAVTRADRGRRPARGASRTSRPARPDGSRCGAAPRSGVCAAPGWCASRRDAVPRARASRSAAANRCRSGRALDGQIQEVLVDPRTGCTHPAHIHGHSRVVRRPQLVRPRRPSVPWKRASRCR